jgi:hypothetical protein
MKKLHVILFTSLVILGTSCGGNNKPTKPTDKDKEEKDTTVQTKETKEEVDTLAGIPGFCKSFFLVGNELTFVQERIETVRCAYDEETGETIDIEPVPKTTKKTIKVTVTKVEKNKKGVWVTTLKHNGEFPKKWYTDEKSIWNDEMAGRFPAEPKPKDREVNGVSTSIYFNKISGCWVYDEQMGDGISGVHFNADKGISNFVFSYTNMCESIELYTKLKSSKL